MMKSYAKKWNTILRKLSPFLFLLPAISIYIIFAFLPTVQVVEYSFFEWDGINPVKDWVGLENYTRLLSDRVFWESFMNTIWWATIIVFINVGIGLILAAVLAQKIKGRTFFQACMFIPVVQAPITTAIVWRWMYQPDGAINAFLNAVGLEFLTTAWLGNLSTVLPAIAIAHAWSTLGLSVVIFLSGLQSVDEDLYDAAKLDGANAVDAFIHVTLPALRPVTAVVFVMTVTGAFKAFDLIWATTKGGPIRASEILSTYMYKKGIIENNYGYGSAIAVALLFIVTLAMAFYLYLQYRQED